MKRYSWVMILLVIVSGATSAGAGRPISYGIHLIAGGRYDDLRMCVGSPAGVKGGPIADIYFDIRFPVSEKGTVALNIPVMRPILFAAAFQMLQFEPQVTYEHYLGESDGTQTVLEAGMGVLFCDRSRVHRFCRFAFKTKNGNWMPELKLFYSPLFSADYPVVTVAGGAVELHYEFGS